MNLAFSQNCLRTVRARPAGTSRIIVHYPQHVSGQTRSLVRVRALAEKEISEAVPSQKSDAPASKVALKTAYDPDFAIRKEQFYGRLAVLAFGAVLLGERITGAGVVQTLALDTNIPLVEMEPLLVLVVGGLTIAGFRPRPQELLSENSNQNRKAIGRAVQHVFGRLACIGLASTIVAEVVTGKGALALMNVQTGVETIEELEAGFAFLALMFLTADMSKGKPAHSYSSPTDRSFEDTDNMED